MKQVIKRKGHSWPEGERADVRKWDGEYDIRKETGKRESDLWIHLFNFPCAKFHLWNFLSCSCLICPVGMADIFHFFHVIAVGKSHNKWIRKEPYSFFLLIATQIDQLERDEPLRDVVFGRTLMNFAFSRFNELVVMTHRSEPELYIRVFCSVNVLQFIPCERTFISKNSF